MKQSLKLILTKSVLKIINIPLHWEKSTVQQIQAYSFANHQDVLFTQSSLFYFSAFDLKSLNSVA